LNPFRLSGPDYTPGNAHKYYIIDDSTSVSNAGGCNPKAGLRVRFNPNDQK
jgi:hypothetical protein